MKQKTNPYSTPEGYFEHLETKLSAIPEQMSGVSTMDRIRPYLALAAAFLFIVTCGTALLRKAVGTLDDQDISTLDKIQLADMLPVTEPDLIYQTTETEEPPEFIEVEMEEEHNWDYECRKILESHTAMYPFSDDEVDQCVQIGPEDFGEFPQRYWTLSENPFLKQGFYNFGHLLFAKVGERAFVGVPGRYHKRDVYLGRSYGFLYFKSVHKSRLKMGDFGYWMMEVHPQPLQVMQEGWGGTSDIKERSNTSESNTPLEEDTQASADRP